MLVWQISSANTMELRFDTDVGNKYSSCYQQVTPKTGHFNEAAVVTLHTIYFLGNVHWDQLQLLFINYNYFRMGKKARNSQFSFISAAVEFQAYIVAFWKRQAGSLKVN